MPTFHHDYHMHSNFSPDCEAPMEVMAHQAAALGVAEIMFTEHEEYHPLEGETCRLRPAAWFAKIERLNAALRGQLVIRAGLEVGQPHQYAAEAQRLIEAYPFDSVTGSLHWIGDHCVFDEIYFSSRPDGQAYRDYFAELARMATAGGFDILAHLDVVKRAGFHHCGSFDIRLYEEQVREVFRGLLANGIALEINTAGLRRKVAEAHPPLVALRWYREMGGELLTIGSDAHKPAQVAAGFDVALELARQAGFARLVMFRQRAIEWMPI